jgi:hypothetical protein
LWFAGVRPAAERPASYEKTVNYSEIAHPRPGRFDGTFLLFKVPRFGMPLAMSSLQPGDVRIRDREASK